MIQKDLFTEAEITTSSPAIAKPFVSRSTFYHGDCLVEMDKIEDKSVDMILCDLPYGTTQNKWDEIISFYKLWEHYQRLGKDNAAIVLFGAEPFSSALRMSNKLLYKYDWVWCKNKFSNFLNSKKQPMRAFENICIFYKKQPVFNRIPYRDGVHKSFIVPKETNHSGNYGTHSKRGKDCIESKIKAAIDVLNFNCVHPQSKEYLGHPTQKPVALMEYLIKTYTNEGETVLDNCMGSGTTGVACKKTGRHFIGIEKDEKYFEIAVSRVSEYFR